MGCAPCHPVSVVNDLHDLVALLPEGLDPQRSAVVSSHPCGEVGWPIEPADLFIVDPARPVAVSTLGDPGLARILAQAAYPGLAAAASTATENVGVEKLVRNILAAPAIQVLILCGPETGGSAPTGHCAGDALLKLWTLGVDPETMRVREALGRRPVLKNLTVAAAEAFRRRIRLVDMRGSVDVPAIAAAIEAAAGVEMTRTPRSAAVGRSEGVGGEVGTLSESSARGDDAGEVRYRPDPVGYLLIFADHSARRLIVEHYTNQHVRTCVLVGTDCSQLARTVVQRGLVGTLDHAAYLGRELQRAAVALAAREPYVQD